MEDPQPGMNIWNALKVFSHGKISNFMNTISSGLPIATSQRIAVCGQLNAM